MKTLRASTANKVTYTTANTANKSNIYWLAFLAFYIVGSRVGHFVGYCWPFE